MRISLLSLLALVSVCSLVFSSPALALSITPVEQSRFFSETWEDGAFPDTFIAATDFGPFLVAGRHDSSIESQQLVGDLAAFGTAVDPYTLASELSRFQLVFDLDEPADYSLAGEIVNTTYVSAGADGGGHARLEAWNPVTMAFENVAIAYDVGDNDPGGTVFDLAGTISPGRYRLWADAIGQGHDHSAEGPSAGNGAVSFALVLTEVPEPGTAPLVCLGLALGALARRSPAARTPLTP